MKYLPVCLAAVFALTATSSAEAVERGQIDTFERGFSDLWFWGAGDWPVVPGGPAGANDHYMEISADGNGYQGKLVAFNSDQWTGNYVLAGVNAIEMDIKAISITAPDNPLMIRIAFRSLTGPGVGVSFGASGYVSSGIPLSADDEWHRVTFYFSTLVPINSSGGVPPAPLATFLTGPAELRIINSLGNSLTGDNFVAVLGIDNIRAIPSASLTAMARLPDKTVRLNYTGKPLAVYTIQASPDLSLPFTSIGTATAATDGTFQFIDLNGPSFNKRFYRATGP